MREIAGGVTSAKGFEAAGAEAAVKYKNRKDMALVFSTAPCKVAGTFTTNVVKAAPVLWDKQVVETSAFAQAVVVNSGIANACTGKPGMDCCKAEAECAGKLLGILTLNSILPFIWALVATSSMCNDIAKKDSSPFERVD